MEQLQELFLQAVEASLENRKVQWTEKLPPQDWLALFRLAQEHHILPMIYEAVYSCPAAQEAEQQLFAHYKRCTVQAVMLQTVKTSEFLFLYAHLRASGVTPCVVKGIICRGLYPNPDYRMSGEEDLLIPPEQFRQCHEAMLEYGMVLSEPEQDIYAAYEVPYGKQGSPVYIELHKSLFPPDSEAYGDLNRFFTGIHDRLIEFRFKGPRFSPWSIRTICFT